jgi:hypothetical protein
MLTMKKILIAAIAATAVTVTAHADTAMKYPKMYEFMAQMGNVAGRPYFQCDYTGKMCERGRIWNGHNRVFEIISEEDRTTVIGHGGCTWSASSYVCWNFTTGTYWGFVNGADRSGDMTVEDQSNWPRPIW